MDFVDYYKILGIEKSASLDQIKKAYRKLARKYHPDLNPNDAASNKKFQEINEANEVLNDPEKRKKYDKYGKDWQHGEQYEQNRQQQNNRSSGNPFQGNYSNADFGNSDFSDFFSSMFGNQGGFSKGRSTKYRGQDYEAALSLHLRDIYTTTKQTVTINNKKVRITIPAGIENQQKIKLSGYGSEGVNGGPAGDLLITISIHPDVRYTRKGNDLYVKESIDLFTAVLGGEHIVETLSGKLKLKIAVGTQQGETVRIKGKGFPIYKKEGQFGDLYVQWHILIPKELTDNQKELFQKLAASNGKDN